MQLKTANELGNERLISLGFGNHYMLFNDNCGICGEDLPGAAQTVRVVAEQDDEISEMSCEA